jgi:hypothetical protein
MWNLRILTSALFYYVHFADGEIEIRSYPKINYQQCTDSKINKNSESFLRKLT